MTRFKIADVVFDADLRYDYTEIIGKDFLYNGDIPPAFTVRISDREISEGKRGEENYSEAVIESLAVYKALCRYLLSTGEGIVLHSSAVAVDGNAYVFTAPSGTGKSTHTYYWRKLLGDRAVMVNDDKPLIKKEKDGFYVCGTPWMGKHHLGANIKVKIKAICKLERGENNSVERIGIPEMFFTVLNETLRTCEGDEETLMKFLEGLLTSVDIYRLKCTPSIEAASLAYLVMSKGE